MSQVAHINRVLRRYLPGSPCMIVGPAPCVTTPRLRAPVSVGTLNSMASTHLSQIEGKDAEASDQLLKSLSAAQLSRMFRCAVASSAPAVLVLTQHILDSKRLSNLTAMALCQVSHSACKFGKGEMANPLAIEIGKRRGRMVACSESQYPALSRERELEEITPEALVNLCWVYGTRRSFWSNVSDLDPVRLCIADCVARMNSSLFCCMRPGSIICMFQGLTRMRLSTKDSSVAESLAASLRIVTAALVHEKSRFSEADTQFLASLESLSVG